MGAARKTRPRDEDPSPAKLDGLRIFTAPPKTGRLDFLFDQRSKGEGASPADAGTAGIPEAPAGPRPWDAPPPPRWRGDRDERGRDDAAGGTGALLATLVLTLPLVIARAVLASAARMAFRRASG